jgi:inorganic phosphate transporter, PiT family
LDRARRDRGRNRLVPVAGLFFGVGTCLDCLVDICPFYPVGSHNTFRVLQFISAALYSLGHGGNDAQKTMGIIAVLLYSQGMLGDTFSVPLWIILTCQAAMALGTLFGGWRIVHTMGSKITRLHPVQGFCAEAGGAATLFLATYFGIPVSTTHTITGAIVGVGAARKVSAVRWNVASNVVTAWILTMPATALIGAAFYALCKHWS